MDFLLVVYFLASIFFLNQSLSTQVFKTVYSPLNISAESLEIYLYLVLKFGEQKQTENSSENSNILQ